MSAHDDKPDFGWPRYTREEADAVSNVLLSNRPNYWGGDEGRQFEAEFAAWADTEYAVAVANGTVALDLAFHAYGIGAGDEVIVTSRTFLASVSSIVNAGATPVFVDVDRDSQVITPANIEAAMTPRTRGIVCVHLAGWPCDMEPIMALAAAHDLVVIEDCAQAHGARYRGQSVGSIGHIAAWSFCQDKIMTTGGEGGMVTTNDPDAWEKVWSYKDHGKSYDAVYHREHPPGFRWLHESFGTNMRLTEMQSAIGRIQLRRMPDWHAARTANAERILSTAERFGGALRVPRPPADIEHGWYKCYVFVRPEGLKSGWNRDRVMNVINEHGVPCFSGSCSEVYLEKAFEGTGLRPRHRLPVARELGETSLMFLVHPTLSEEAVELTCDAIAGALAGAAR
jgi:dTDP-4-amino-4,6-dideoxygalactose transaminase